MSNVIPFPERKESVNPIRVIASPTDGTTFRGKCSGIVHFFVHVPGRCQCTKEFWDGTTKA